MQPAVDQTSHNSVLHCKPHHLVPHYASNLNSGHSPLHPLSFHHFGVVNFHIPPSPQPPLSETGSIWTRPILPSMFQPASKSSCVCLVTRLRMCLRQHPHCCRLSLGPYHLSSEQSQRPSTHLPSFNFFPFLHYYQVIFPKSNSD